MAKRGLSDEQLERLLYESSDSELEDNIQREDREESDESGDSLSDPEWVPEDEDYEFEKSLNKIWGQKKDELKDLMIQSQKKPKFTKLKLVEEAASQGILQDEVG